MGNQQIRWNAEAQLIAKHGTMSSRKLAELLKAEYGIVVSHMTVQKDLDLDLQSISLDEIEEKKGHILSSLEELATIAFTMAKGEPDGRVKLAAMETYRKLMDSRANILTHFEEAKLKMNESQRPIYQVFIGKPKETDLKKLVEKEKNATNPN
jgi:hypothetical protein